MLIYTYTFVSACCCFLWVVTSNNLSTCEHQDIAKNKSECQIITREFRYFLKLFENDPDNVTSPPSVDGKSQSDSDRDAFSKGVIVISVIFAVFQLSS